MVLRGAGNYYCMTTLLLGLANEAASKDQSDCRRKNAGISYLSIPAEVIASA